MNAYGQLMPGAWKITTESGSIYHVMYDDNGQWWMRGDNKATEQSVHIGLSTWWKITTPRPWPPYIGLGLVTRSALQELPFDTPGRMPGGGKNTSPVVSVVEIDPVTLIAKEA